MLSKFLTATILPTLVLSISAHAAVDKSELLNKIRSSSGNYKEFIALLNSPDKSLRFAAFDQIVNSGDPVMVELAISEAINYPDQAMQALGFQYQIKQSKRIVFLMETPKNASDQTKKIVADYGSAYPIDFSEFYKDGGFECFRTGSCKGSLNGQTISIYYAGGDNCKVNASLKNDGYVKGYLACNKAQPIPISMQLR
ncbi:hypothetical protein [Marinomonas sp. ef1]|uniref:hypothetical protein n=1 Tax=Marinomonas sp. ef1 TaxID=2005043 RepID=UPI000C286937|nr:hypothetical protein [Marinomonas sp. ef1]